MKDAYYFPHDANAQNDPNIIKLLYNHSWAGYGLYWSIIEKLRNEPDYTMETDYDMIAYALRVEADEIKSIIEDFNLFIIEKGYFYSESLKRRMSRLDAIKEKRAYAGKMSGISRNQTKPEQPSNNGATSVEQVLNSKAKHSKVNKRKEKNINIEFENFWNLYNYKVGSKIKVLKKWEALTDLDRGMVMEHLPHYIQSTPDKQFRKHPATYLNNQGWFDEIVISQNGAADFKLDSTGNSYMGYCDNCNKSDFYKKEDLHGDSRCCNSKILNERKKDDKKSN